MYTLAVALLGATLVSAQVPPPESLLTATKSGVLPVLPTQTPFGGVETEEGAIIYDGPANPGFVGPGGSATAQANLPAATYQAVLPSTNFDPLTGSTITGSITGSSVAGGAGVNFNVNFNGFPDASYGPFVYHIHGLPVPADGNCTETLGHLDPTNRGEYYPCDQANPQTCQVGDLAGKHGNITGTSFSAQYNDAYLSTDPSSPSFFGSLSVVIHAYNTTRLTCANFQMVSSNGTTGTNTSVPTSGPVPTSPTTPSITPYPGIASNVAVSGMAGLLSGVMILISFFM